MTNKTNTMRYAVYMIRARSSYRNPGGTPPPMLNPSVTPVEGLEASSLSELLDEFGDWLHQYQPESNDGFDIRVRSYIGDTDEWLRDDWTPATLTIEFREFQGNLNCFKQLDPAALAWAADDGSEVS